MYALFRRLIPIVVVLMLLTPVAVFARSETAARLVELVFSNDDSSVKITETIESTARVSFTHDGQDYVMKVPVTIEIDETIPIADSESATDAAARVGVFAIVVAGMAERDAIEIGYSTLEAGEDNKLVAVGFSLTNLSDESRDFDDLFSGEQVVGLDDMGRRFEAERIFGCEEVNPGSTVDCIVVFEVAENVTIMQIEVYAIDKRVVPIPEAEEEEDQEES